MTPREHLHLLTAQLFARATEHLVGGQPDDFLACGTAMTESGQMQDLAVEPGDRGPTTNPEAADILRAELKRTAGNAVAFGILTHVVDIGAAGETRRAIEMVLEHRTGICARWKGEYGYDERGRLAMGAAHVDMGTPWFFRKLN